MENEDVMLDQMGNTRTALTEKLETLETQLASLLDVAGWVRAYPWPMVGGAAALGFVVERTLTPSATRPHSFNRGGQFRLPPDHISGEDAFDNTRSGPSFFSDVLKTFEPEIKRLKGLALGKLMGMVEELVVTVAPHDIARQVRDILHDVTTKVGGEVLEEKEEPAHTSSELA